MHWLVHNGCAHGTSESNLSHLLSLHLKNPSASYTQQTQISCGLRVVLVARIAGPNLSWV